MTLKMMSKKNENMEHKRDPDPLKAFEGAGIPWEKSSDEVWAAMQESLPEKTKVYRLNSNRSFIRYAVAAVLVILLGIPSLMRFYTKTIESGSAEHLDIVLPDGSTIAMNAESVIEYHPMWWRFKRDVKLRGEAYFEVVKGKDFVVESERASTAVLGTSFNILSRDSRYIVTCLTGKVKVFTANEESEVFLLPNQKAFLAETGIMESVEDSKAERSVSWTDNEFFFTAVSLDEVFAELERQYDINIKLDIGEELIYTGNFSRQQDVETVLDLVCKPFGIKFEQIAKETYLVSKDDKVR